MSMKAECPACDSETSELYRAFQEGDPCPYCGLPADAANAVLAARERGASEQLVERAAKAEQRAAKAEQEARRLREALDRIERWLAEVRKEAA